MSATRHVEFDAAGDYVNAILIDPQDVGAWPLEDGHVLIAHEAAGSGWRYEGGELVPPASEPEVAPVPDSVTRRQMLLGLVAMEMITPEEALAAAQTGAVPAAIDAIFATLSPEDALAARIAWASMSICERDHPLVAAIAAANDLSGQDIDDAFRAWAGV